MALNIGQVIELIPKVIDLVKKVEELIPGEGQGEQKLNFVLDLVKTAVSEAGIVDVKNIPSIVTAVVKVIVTFFNGIGVFKKSAKA